MAFTDHASLSQQLHWLLLILGGILMCKLVYQLTSIVSLSFCKDYTKLNNAQKLEWNNRGFSTFHALVVAVASLYQFSVYDLFDEGSKLIINKRSTLSETTLGISIGYFLSDLAMILWNFPALGGMEFVLHHGLAMFSLFLSLLSGQGQIYILMVLFSEITTPFVNLRWYLDVTGQKQSKFYASNGVALFLGWLVARILLFIFFFYHLFNHFDQIKEVFPLGYYSLLLVTPALTVMNLYWFWKIVKGLMKTLSKARHTHSQ